MFSTLKEAGQSVSTYNWVSVDADVQSSNLLSAIDDEARVYHAQGRYRYAFGNITYTSEKIYFDSQPDSDRKFHTKFVDSLTKARNDGVPIKVWVNPRNPSESVYYRGLHLSSFLAIIVFSTIFLCVGLGLIYVSYLTSLPDKPLMIPTGLYPDGPWKWKWESPLLKNVIKNQFMFLLVISLIWNSFSMLILSVMHEELIVNKNYLASIALLFPISGAIMIWYTCVLYFRGKRFKRSAFELVTFPAALGHYVKGTLHLDNQLPGHATFETKLSCLHCYIKGSGDNSKYYEDILWQEAQHIPASAGHLRETFEIPMLFRLPDDKPTSTPRDQSDEYIWRLDISTKIAGPDFRQSFDIPVFDPKEFPEIVPPTIDFNSPNVKHGMHKYEGSLDSLGVIIQEYENGTYYFFPSARHKLKALGITIGSAVLWAISLLIILSPTAPMTMGLFVALFAGLCTYASIHTWFFKSSVEITRDTLILRRGFMSGRSVEYGLKEIRELSFKDTIQSGAKRYYEVFAHTISGKKLKIADALPGLQNVERLTRKMNSELGL